MIEQNGDGCFVASDARQPILMPGDWLALGCRACVRRLNFQRRGHSLDEPRGADDIVRTAGIYANIDIELRNTAKPVGQPRAAAISAARARR